MAIPHVERGKLVAADQQNAMIDQVNENTEAIELLMTTGGGTPSDPFVNWYAGDGEPPDAIEGSRRGDMYVNRLDGELFQLQ